MLITLRWRSRIQSGSRIRPTIAVWLIRMAAWITRAQVQIKADKKKEAQNAG